jgi:hypothetical protein
VSLKDITNNTEAWQVVLAISELHAARLKTMNFISYRSIPGIHDRISSDIDPEIKALFAEAAHIKKEGLDPRYLFDIAFSLAIPKGLGEQVSKEMLKEPDPSTRARIPIDLDDGSLRETLVGETSIKPREVVFAVASMCMLRDGSEAHIPMMDFRLRPPAGQEAIVTMMRSISPAGGAVLQTENSYHFYGPELLDSKQWLAFLGKSLLFQSIADDRFIGHRLQEGFCVLRLTCGPFHDAVPIVVESW